MRRKLSLQTVLKLILVLVYIAGIVPTAQAAQSQGPAKEPQKNEKPAKSIDELNKELMMAFAQKQQEKYETLIKQGADVNAMVWSTTMLHIAVRNMDKEGVAFLLEKGALVDVKDGGGRTPLHISSGAYAPKQKRDPNIVSILVSNGADVNATDNNGLTAMHYAVKNGFENIVKILPSYNANVNAPDKNGVTPLHYAVAGMHREIIVMLFKHGASANVKDNAGRTSLHYAAEAARSPVENKESFRDIAELLLGRGAAIDAQDNVGWTPLHYAVSRRNQSVIKLFIARGADLSIVNNRGDTAYSWNSERASFQARHSVGTPHALVNKHFEIAKLLRADGGAYIVALDGKDDNPGILEQPFRTIAAALEVVGPGDVIYIRGGTYRCERPILIDKSGAQGNPIGLKAYPGEAPILDFSDVRGASLSVSGAYWHIKGLVVVNGYYGVMVWGLGAHHNILEKMTARDNGWGGILFRDGAGYNISLNCDSYQNFDPEFNGDTCDGFSVAFFVGQGNTFIGNRSWNNSDDGYDCWKAGSVVRLERCYAWRNGENIWDHPFFDGNGNGFKLGGGEGKHILTDCIAWNHTHRGFDLNSNKSGVTLINCTALRNGDWNYRFDWDGWHEEATSSCVFSNNISYDGKREDIINPNAKSHNNSWNADIGLTLTEDDFVSLDDSVMSAPRNSDGSIPQNDFLRLAPGSAVIDKGADVGMPFVGARPDLGSFEYDPNETSQGYVKMLHQAVRDHDVKQIEQLLAQGEGIDDKDWLGYTPLHWAVYFGYPDLVELLISKGADPNIQSDTGRFALEIARAMTSPEEKFDFTNLEALLRKLGAKIGDVTPNESGQTIGESTER